MTCNYQWIDDQYLSMDNNHNYISKECMTSKSLPNVFFTTPSNRKLQLNRSNSLSFCLRSTQDCKRISKLNLLKNVMTKKNSNPTIGDLLGDDDFFHSQYHHQYSASKFSRKRYYYRSSRASLRHNQRKQQRSNEFHPIKESPPSFFNVILESNPVYLYPSTYDYSSLPTYCYCCYPNIASCCSCFISDCYTGFYPQEISSESPTFQYNSYQQMETYPYSTSYFYDKKRRKSRSYPIR